MALTLLELKTYRGRAFRGRPEEIPHPRGGSRLEGEMPARPVRRGSFSWALGVATEADLASIEAEHAAQVAEAITLALASPFPAPATALDHVYAP